MGRPVYLLTVVAGGLQQSFGIDKQTFDVLHWTYTDSKGTDDRTFYNIKPNDHPRIEF